MRYLPKDRRNRERASVEPCIPGAFLEFGLFHVGLGLVTDGRRRESRERSS